MRWHDMPTQMANTEISQVKTQNNLSFRIVTLENKFPLQYLVKTNENISKNKYIIHSLLCLIQKNANYHWGMDMKPMKWNITPIKVN